jgi:hypothetical protein
MTVKPDSVVSSFSLIVVLPADADVLCGKTSTNKHPGNVYFRDLVLSKVDSYMRAVRKAQKGIIVAYIMKELHKNKARFLKLDKKTKVWKIISPADATEKVSHAIRDRVRERKNGNIAKADIPTLSMPPSSLIKANVSKKRNISNKKRVLPFCSRNIMVSDQSQSSAATVTPPTVNKRIKIVQGGEDLMTLNPEINEDSSLSICESLFPEFLDAAIDSSSCSPIPYGDNFMTDIQPFYPPLVEDYGASQTIVPYLDPCDFLLRESCSDDTPLNDLWSTDIDDPSPGDANLSVSLDDLDELDLDDSIPSHEDDSDFVIAMLQQACFLMID